MLAWLKCPLMTSTALVGGVFAAVAAILQVPVVADAAGAVTAALLETRWGLPAATAAALAALLTAARREGPPC